MRSQCRIKYLIVVNNDVSTRARDEGLIASILAALTFVTVMVSCEPMWIRTRPTPRVWIEGESARMCIDVNTQTLPQVINAVKMWDEAIGSWKHLIPVVGMNDTCDYVIVETQADRDAAPMALASTTLFGRVIKLYKNRYELDPLGVTLHEIGHVLGARHMEGTLMAPTADYGRYRCPDAATVAQVAMANSIDPSLLKWCSSI